MFQKYCCCCIKTDLICFPIKTKSSHGDGKMLQDYFNSVFGSVLQHHDNSNYICKRCSKALQVAYHFIHMVKESNERNYEDITAHEEEEVVQYKIQDQQDSSSTFENANPQNELNIESQLKCPIIASEMPLNELVSLKLPTNFETCGNESNTVDVSSEAPKTSNDDLRCVICNELFENKQSYFEHRRQVHKEIVPYKCKLCTFYTCYTESLFKHCAKSHGLNNFAVDLCQTNMETRIMEEYPEFKITYLCIPCNLKASSQASIEEHLIQEHSIDEDKDSIIKEYFNCPLCCRSFTTLKSAKIHYSMYHSGSLKHTNICNKRKFDCNKCGKLFDLKSGLFLHRRLCEQRESVKCNFCTLQFNSVLKYERHLQVNHSVVIKHECEICSKTFSCSEYLTVHRKRHNERYHQCDLCPKSYISNADLKVHKQRIHATKHVFTCAVCGKKFGYFALLKYHENKAHNKKSFKCGICDFVSQSSPAINSSIHTNAQTL